MDTFIVLIIIALILYWFVKKRKKKQILKYRKATDTVVNKNEVKNNFYEFEVDGVLGNNEAGKDIQNIIKQISNQYKKSGAIESFESMTAKQMKEEYFEGSEFEGECIEGEGIVKLDIDKEQVKVYLMDVNDKYHHVGFAKNDIADKLIESLLKYKNTYFTIEFTGGKYKSVEFDTDKGKDFLITKETNRGLLISIDLDNDD